jgi:Rieske Fe-S protein
MKVCTKCNLKKPLDEFPKGPKCLDGHRGVCTKCKYKKDRPSKLKYIDEHSDRVALSHIKYRTGKKNNISDSAVRYYTRNIEKIFDKRQIAKPKKVAYDAKRTLDPKVKKKRSEYNQTPQAKETKRRVDNRRRAAEGSCSEEQWQAQIALYDGRCVHCGCNWNALPEKRNALPDERWKTVEHIRPIHRGGSDWPENRAPACSKCNTVDKDLASTGFYIKSVNHS